MNGTERLREDIAYVRAATEQSEIVHVRAYGFLWAGILLCGYTLVDFVDDPRWIARYWNVAMPVGFALSVWLVNRANRGAGQVDRQLMIRSLMHWLAFVAAGLLGEVLVATGQLHPAGMGSLWLLLLALTYFLSGVHVDRRLLPLGVVLAGCYLITIFVPTYAWTAAGALAAAALVAHALLGRPGRAAAS